MKTLAYHSLYKSSENAGSGVAPSFSKSTAHKPQLVVVVCQSILLLPVTACLIEYPIHVSTARTFLSPTHPDICQKICV